MILQFEERYLWGAISLMGDSCCGRTSYIEARTHTHTQDLATEVDVGIRGDDTVNRLGHHFLDTVASYLV